MRISMDVSPECGQQSLFTHTPSCPTTPTGKICYALSKICIAYGSFNFELRYALPVSWSASVCLRRALRCWGALVRARSATGEPGRVLRALPAQEAVWESIGNRKMDAPAGSLACGALEHARACYHLAYSNMVYAHTEL